MKKALLFLLCLLLMAIPLAACGGEDETTPAGDPADNPATDAVTSDPAGNGTDAPSSDNGDDPATSDAEQMKAQIKESREAAFDAYVASLPAARAEELVGGKVTYVTVGQKKMKVSTVIRGQKPADGYPLFISLHGGGGVAPEVNDEQWKGMDTRYANTGRPAIFVAPRAIANTPDLHSVPDSFAFYDRIIEDACLFLGANPNKIYIVGYSAGGDGVYQIAPRMPDRFAAANMSAGHPNGISLVNLYQLPFFLQVGELDSAYDRNKITVQMGKTLDTLQKSAGGGFIHEVFVHAGKEHGVVGDNSISAQSVLADPAAWLSGKESGRRVTATHAVYLMMPYVRNPLPERLLWNLAVRTPQERGVESFYWLSAPLSVSQGTLDIAYDKSTNTVTVNKCNIAQGQITVWLNEEMIDFTKEVTFVWKDGSQTTFAVTPDEAVMKATAEERGDLNFVFAASFSFDVKTGAVSH